jgi:hypothetical protein
MVNTGTTYFTQKNKLYTGLHQRIFQDVRDIIGISAQMQDPKSSLSS